MIVTGKIRSRIAILFMAAFISTLLIKPLHVLSHNFHHTSCVSQTNSNQESTTSKGHHDCGICHFTLSAYTFQELTEFKSIILLPAVEVIDKEYETYFSQLSLHPTLRGPPTV